MSIPGLGSLGGGGDQSSQSLNTNLKQAFEGVGSITLGGSGGSSSGRGGDGVSGNVNSNNTVLYIVGGIAAIAVLALIVKSG
jgi:hypothetical protein